MKKRITYLLLWALCCLSNSAFALDKVDGVYQIGTADELIEFANIVNGGENDANAVLTADIDMDGKDFVPIGCLESRYIGTFDGQYHVIDNIMYIGSSRSGIFGVVNGAQITRIAIESFSFPHTAGAENQQFSIKAYSDDDFSLLIEQ